MGKAAKAAKAAAKAKATETKGASKFFQPGTGVTTFSDAKTDVLETNWGDIDLKTVTCADDVMVKMKE